MLRKLTLKQKAFIEEYLTNGGNGVKAAERAEYKGCYNTLGSIAVENLQKLAIKNAIAVRTKELEQQTGYSIEQAQQEYEQARALAMEIRQPAAAATAVTGKARLFGFDKDGSKPVVAIVNVINYAGSAGVKPPKVIDSVPIEPQEPIIGEKEV